MIEKYKKEMLDMYKTVNATLDTLDIQPLQQTIPIMPSTQSSTTGALIGIATAVRALYPVSNAKVTVFTGTPENMQIIDTDMTDQSGRTKTFILPTPEKALSLEETNTTLPYSVYNMMVEADGYLKNIHLNIPIFSGITSLQQSNLLLEETAGVNKGPQIFDESQKYEL